MLLSSPKQATIRAFPDYKNFWKRKFLENCPDLGSDWDFAAKFCMTVT